MRPAALIFAAWLAAPFALFAAAAFVAEMIGRADQRREAERRRRSARMQAEIVEDVRRRAFLRDLHAIRALPECAEAPRERA